MANNQLLSPGVATRELDLSQRRLDIPAVGAAVVGPTVRGPAMVPTPVSTYSEYIRLFGDVFTSGSGISEKLYKYLTTYTVEQYLKHGQICTVTRILAGNYQPAYSYVMNSSSYQQELAGAGSYLPSNFAFKIVALSEGDILNSGRLSAAQSGSGKSADETTNGVLLSGSQYNIRWEINNVDTSRGTFNLLVRRADDINNRKIVIESYEGVSLDPNSPLYITRVIGDQSHTLRYDSSGMPYLEKSGSYPNRSRFIRIESVNNQLNYLNSNGSVRDVSLSGSLPAAVSGTFAGGSDGNVVHPRAMYEDIWNANTQGLHPASSSYGQTAYQDALDILANREQYDINLLFLPGLVDTLTNHSQIITRAINLCEDRGDCMLVMDSTHKGATVGQAQIAAEGRNTNYAATYYPWVQTSDPDLGRNVWVPPSTMVAAVYSFNDKVAHPWFAPAGLNRGILDTVIQTERMMTVNDRDNLYTKSINPLATFPRDGIAVWGQKTLQKKPSALDRINVRRLLIDAKRFVAYESKYVLFENNTIVTRAKFLERVEPYFRRVQNQQGLYDYRIIVDETNNTADVIDRNELRCQIYLKPAKTIEYIYVDFIILPTGALFPTDEAA